VLLIPSVLAKRLRLLDDFQLARLLDDEVGTQLNLLAPESTICLAAADRLRGHVNHSSGRRQFGIRRRARGSWVAERDEGTHILNAEVALYRGGIPFLQLPWRMNRFASNKFLVTNVAEAKACLLRAGLRETPRSPTLLVDVQTGRSIRLYEDRT